jgi:hypothetical protein
MSARNRKLRMEQMEARQLMAVTPIGDFSRVGTLVQAQPAGDVSAYVQNGNLYVNESSSFVNSDNGVRIARLDNGMFRVMGAEANNTSGIVSSINGYAYQDFSLGGNAQLFVNLKGGNDRLHLGLDGGTGTPIFAAMQINMAATDPVVAYAKTGAAGTSIFNVPDADQVFIWNATSRNTVTINTGAGADWVFLGKATIGDGLGVDNLVINTGAGADQVTMMGTMVRGNLDIQTYSALSETDADTVYFDTSLGTTTFVSGNINLRTGGGADSVYSTDPGDADSNVFWLGIESLGSMSIDTGAGNDIAYLRNIRVHGNFVMFAGAGADSLDMRLTDIDPSFGIAGAVNGDLYVQMYADTSEADADAAAFDDVGAGMGMSVLMGGGNDTLKLLNSTAFDNMLLDAGAGNDVVDLNNVFGVDNFFALLGDGDDILTTFNLYQPVGLARIDGGNGTDRLTKSGAFPAARLEQTNWEYVNGIRQGLFAQIATVNATRPKKKV